MGRDGFLGDIFSSDEKSAQANQGCVDILNNYMVTRCTYDCVCDGIGK